jgi:hypothetical protein
MRRIKPPAKRRASRETPHLPRTLRPKKPMKRHKPVAMSVASRAAFWRNFAVASLVKPKNAGIVLTGLRVRKKMVKIKERDCSIFRKGFSTS